VLAYVGASGALASARHVDSVQARRQAGSTLKPFLYALAIERRVLTAASLLDDSPLEVAADNGLFRPRDYDEQFRGLVSVRSALAASLNLPAVRTLLLVGVDAFAEQLRDAGFRLPRSGDYYGPSLALGSADVTLWELVGGYRALANGGRWTALRMRPGEPPPEERRAAGDAAAFIVSDILADRDSRSITFGLENPLATRFWTAVKTGTSKDMRDNWCIGYSRRYTVGVWVGNASGEPMRDVSGITGAAPVWEDVMTWLHRDTGSSAPSAPGGVQAARARFLDGVEPPRTEWFLAGTEPAGDTITRARAPRIVAPSDGTIIALDPDIPEYRQRVPFAAEAVAGDAHWLLDRRDLGAVGDVPLWAPTPGRHVLELVDGAARPLDRVAFDVRG
jgi:penicillin-binding protein 1C